ncbi:hypothetical protein FYJ24_11945 [Actinomycetaceae bacterium WB03_NA08]|uniref:Type II toxin-antitoxin system HicA family toxin n=1 Tax=Scrofimicrobium canadense TaxID=2652290 RepID=A0A6N7VWS3_9ACTO|nr:hypothetical protein [Scrofimicrobium canadense]MSS85440.1 hypothetical protein [Scrofimicrobium canadense]
MKRVVLMKRLEAIAKARGERMVVREGGNHTRVWIGESFTVVPRHREIKEMTAKSIMKDVEK